MSDLIWNYDDVDVEILKVYDHNTMIGYFRIDIDTFTFAIRKVNTLLLKSVMEQYDKAKNEAELIKER